jgi:hypothetical protein
MTEEYYRRYGGKAFKDAEWYSRTPQRGPLQSKMDLGLKLEWGNDATRSTSKQFPPNTVIYEGAAAPQDWFQGGGNQIFIPKHPGTP